MKYQDILNYLSFNRRFIDKRGKQIILMDEGIIERLNCNGAYEQVIIFYPETMSFETKMVERSKNGAFIKCKIARKPDEKYPNNVNLYLEEFKVTRHKVPNTIGDM